MSLLFTGASGFIGKHLARMLETEDVLCLAGKNIPGHRTIVHKGHCYDDVDLSAERIDEVLLLGAVTPKGEGKETAEDYVSNVTGVLSLLKVLPNVPRRIIFASSVSVYVNEGKIINEKSPLESGDMYSLSKLMCEKILEEYCHKNHVQLLIARLGNVYGEGEETYRKLIGTFVSKAMTDEEIEIFSDGKETRNLIYVKDVCYFLKEQIDSQFVGVVNVVSAHEYTIMELVEMVKRITGSSGPVSVLQAGRGRSDHYDATCLYSAVEGFRETSMEDGIRNMVNAWRQHV